MSITLHSSSGRWRLGLALSLLTAFLWGILPIALAIVLQRLDVYTTTWYRFLIAFGLLGVFLAQKRQLPPLKHLGKTAIGLFGIAITGLAINYLLFMKGLVYTSAANAELMIQLAPIFFGLGALKIFKERYTQRQWSGLGILTFGFVLFFNEQIQGILGANQQYLFGTGLLVIASLTWAVYALAQKQLLQQLPSTNIMFIIYGVSALIITPIVNPLSFLSLNALEMGMLFFCGLNTLIAYGSFAEALEHWDASKVSAVIAIAPIITLASAALTNHFFPTLIKAEHLTPLGVIGAILVVFGSIIIALGKHQPKLIH